MWALKGGVFDLVVERIIGRFSHPSCYALSARLVIPGGRRHVMVVDTYKELQRPYRRSSYLAGELSLHRSQKYDQGNPNGEQYVPVWICAVVQRGGDVRDRGFLQHCIKVDFVHEHQLDRLCTLHKEVSCTSSRLWMVGNMKI